MRVRCGACRSEFDVNAPGRYQCPVCGSVNQVRNAGPPAGVTPARPPAPPPSQDPPSPRVTCPDCAFSFIVGSIALATCPNCGAEVPTGKGA